MGGKKMTGKIGKRNGKGVAGVLIAASVVCNLCGCGGGNNAEQPENAVVEEALPAADTETAVVQAVGAEKSAAPAADTGAASAQQTTEPVTQGNPQNAQSGEDLDAVEPNAADDDWYRRGDIYTDDNGRRLEVFFNDEGMLEFAVDGLSMYYTVADDYQQENDWRIYTCDDGTVIIYYPGTPAHLEISDGEYAGIYEAGGKVE